MKTIRNTVIALVMYLFSLVAAFCVVATPSTASAAAHRVVIDHAALESSIGVCEEGYRVTVFVTHDQYQSMPGASELVFHTPSYDASDLHTVQLYCGTRPVTAPASGITVH